MSDRVGVVLLMSGALAAGYGVAALFFLRFWRDTRDRLFVFFGMAFALLALQRVALACAILGGRDTLVYYVLRLGAFLLIIAAIVDKNRSKRGVRGR